MMHHYTIHETGIMLHSLPAGSFDLHLAWIGNAFRVAVKTAESGELIFFRSYVFGDDVKLKDVLHPLKEIVSTDLLFANTYRLIKIGFQGRSELFPSEFYDENEHEQQSELLKTLPIKVVQHVEASEVEFYSAFFPLAKYSILSAAWLNLILPQATHENLFIHIDHHLLYISYAVSSNEIRFFNSFEFKTVEDFAYFTNLVSTELKLDRSQLNIVFSGDIVRPSRIYDMAFAYFQKVTFFETDTILYSSLFHNFPRHLHLPLFSL